MAEHWYREQSEELKRKDRLKKKLTVTLQRTRSSASLQTSELEDLTKSQLRWKFAVSLSFCTRLISILLRPRGEKETAQRRSACVFIWKVLLNILFRVMVQSLSWISWMVGEVFWIRLWPDEGGKPRRVLFISVEFKSFTALSLCSLFDLKTDFYLLAPNKQLKVPGNVSGLSAWFIRTESGTIKQPENQEEVTVQSRAVFRHRT